jgi:hypothetical protein
LTPGKIFSKWVIEGKEKSKLPVKAFLGYHYQKVPFQWSKF